MTLAHLNIAASIAVDPVIPYARHVKTPYVGSARIGDLHADIEIGNDRPLTIIAGPCARDSGSNRVEWAKGRGLRGGSSVGRGPTGARQPRESAVAPRRNCRRRWGSLGSERPVVGDKTYDLYPNRP